jgi:putative PEP-CTERM system integral membrane protein
MSTSPWFRFVVKALFWSWNVLLLAVVVFGFVPLVVAPLVIDAIDGLARWDFVSTSLVVVVVPFFSVWHAWQHRRQHDEHPLELLTFFFGVELALLAVTAGRLFGLHELTGAGEVIFAAIVVGGFVAEVRVVLGDRLPPSQIFDGAMNIALVFRALAGAYVGVLLSSISVPLLAQIVWNVGDIAAEASFAALLLLPLWLWAFALVALLLVLPVAAPLSWWHVARRSSALVRQRWGVDDLLVTTLSPTIAFVVAVAVQWTQPHVGVLSRIAQLADTDADRRALVADREHIERGLVDAYLGRHTYLDDDSSHPWSLASDWQRGYHERGFLSAVLDNAVRDYGRPFFYEGVFGDDAAQARSAYRAFFGRELERDHAAEVRKALAARWSRDQRFAGFVDEGQARVRLQRQDVTIRNDRQGVVDVDLHDTWVNQTGTDQEVVLSFELPESAAVTGLWLGPTDNRAEAFAHIVSPRGAAQQVYREEVRAHRDPALLEQTGPRQYRLRVFPLPARPGHAASEILANGWEAKSAPRVHVWVTYEALPDDDGGVPLPRLRERRNGFWDARTTRHVHFGSDVLGLSSAVDADAVAVDAIDGGEWVQTNGLALPRVARATVSARVNDACAALVPTAAPATPLLGGRTVDVVVDRSLAVADHQQALIDALTALRATGATLQFTLGTSNLRNARPDVVDHYDDEDVRRTVFFGAAQPKELLSQWISNHHEKLPDVIVVLAGGASFDVATDTPLPLSTFGDRGLPRTLLVHLDGAMPSGYDDATLDAIRRSGGTATTSVRDALLRLQDTPWVDGHRFDARASGDGACPSSGPGRAIVARQSILLADRGGKAALSALDGLHRLAVDASVATPYSSLLVLVNAQQRARLAQLSSEQDRFNREVDDDGKGAGLARLKAAVRATMPTRAPRAAAANDLQRFRANEKHAAAPSDDEPAPRETSDESIRHVTAEAAPSAALATTEAVPAAMPRSAPRASAGARNAPASAAANAPARAAVAPQASAKDEARAPTQGADKVAAVQTSNDVVASDPATAVDPIVDVAPSADNVQPANAPTSPPPSVSGVPEPEEWLLIVLAIAAVAVFELRRRRLV